MHRTLVIGDVHLTKKDIHRSTELLNRISKEIYRTRPDSVILLGDVFDTHDVHQNDVITAYSNFILENERLTKIYHVLGNHEMNDSRTFLPDSHVLNAWKGRPNVVICDRPFATQLGDTSVAFIPYVPAGQFSRALEMVGIDHEIVFAHQEFKNCDMGGFVSVHGDEYEGYAQIISGHIHGRHRLGKVWYPGTPCQHSFGEDGDKRIYLLEIMDGNYRILEEIDLKMPEFRTIHTDVAKSVAFELEEGHKYRIVVSDVAERILMFKKSEIYKSLSKRVKFQFEPTQKEAKRVENVRNLTFEQRFAELVRENKLEGTYETIFGQLP